MTVNQLVRGSIPRWGAKYGAIVYRSGHQVFILGSGVQLPVALPTEINCMKLFEATIRVDGKEFKDRVGANTADEARRLLQQRYGPRAVPFMPHMIPS